MPLSQGLSRMSELPPPLGNDRRTRRAIVLTSHPQNDAARRLPIVWGAGDARARGPVVGSLLNPGGRNAIGTHSGAYSIYRALAVAAGQLAAEHKPDLTNTAPAAVIGPFPQWYDADRIVSLDPWGHLVGQCFTEELALGWD